MNNPKALYIHIPFCDHICDYCDFTKLQYFRIMADKYLKALKEEIHSKVKNNLETIYVGGGTPTSLDDDLFQDLFLFLKNYSKNVNEFTVECNPESLSEEKLLIMKNAGVNRLSIGVESTDDKILTSINRKHTWSDVINAVNKARNLGFNNINLDLIIGLPNVTKTLFIKDLDKLLSLDPEHISCYSLTVHEHTVFGNKKVEEPDNEFARELYDYAHLYLLNKGYTHYEISNWAKRGKESLHNYVYWKNEQYYGCGLGASGYIGDIRYTNTKNFNKYIDGDFIDYQEKVDLLDKKEYQIMLNLRTIKGLDLIAYKDMFNEDLLKTKAKEVDELVKNNLLKLENDSSKLVPTYEGMMLLDSIILKLI